jgi:hypothetical protein
MEARVPLQPRLDFGMLVGGVVVGDQVHIEEPGCLGIDHAGAHQVALDICQPAKGGEGQPPGAGGSPLRSDKFFGDGVEAAFSGPP